MPMVRKPGTIKKDDFSPMFVGDQGLRKALGAPARRGATPRDDRTPVRKPIESGLNEARPEGVARKVDDRLVLQQRLVQQSYEIVRMSIKLLRSSLNLLKTRADRSRRDRYGSAR
jgi:hypothetical protein